MGGISFRTRRFVTANQRFALHALWPQMFWSKVVDGLDWETIIEEWHGSTTKEAIAEAVSLSRQAFLEHVDKYALESSVA